jgi:hypothetical protein
MSPFWTWYLEYEPFKTYHSDILVTVAPGGIQYHVCSPEIISQIGARRRDFTKPLELYTILDTYGSIPFLTATVDNSVDLDQI